jgi:hypothetical protein
MKRKLVVVADSLEELDPAPLAAASDGKEVVGFGAAGHSPCPKPGTVKACHQIDSSFLCLFGFGRARASLR